MNDLLSYAKAVIVGLIALFMALLSWIVNKHVKRLELLEGVAVTKADLNQLRNDMDHRDDERREDYAQLREDMQRRHDENLLQFQRVNEGIQRTHTRVDTLVDRRT